MCAQVPAHTHTHTHNWWYCLKWMCICICWMLVRVNWMRLPFPLQIIKPARVHLRELCVITWNIFSIFTLFFSSCWWVKNHCADVYIYIFIHMYTYLCIIIYACRLCVKLCHQQAYKNGPRQFLRCTLLQWLASVWFISLKRTHAYKCERFNVYEH